MKIRNKKTGVIVSLLGLKVSAGIIWINIEFQGREPKAYCYNSLAELNEEWEDYKPKEPLIKDEKIHKAVRAWAEVNGLNNVAFEDYDDENCYFIDRDYEPQIWFPKKSVQGSSIDDGKIYSITELCGEEDECES